MRFNVEAVIHIQELIINNIMKGLDIVGLFSLFSLNSGWKYYKIQTDKSEMIFECNPINIDYDFKGNPFSFDGEYILLEAKRSDGYVVTRRLTLPKDPLKEEDKLTLEKILCEQFLRDCLSTHLNPLFKECKC